MHFYPRSPCGERHDKKAHIALRVINFYPRSPCGERPQCGCACWYDCIFLSTLSLRRATSWSGFSECIYAFLSTLSLRRATASILCTSNINIFLSTLSLRRATFRVAVPEHLIMISIHALLAESDIVQRGPRPHKRDFYPRSPCGERRRPKTVTKTP